MTKTTLEKEAYYFPHFNNARNDRKILRLRMEFQLEGYAIFFMLLEVLKEEKGYMYPFEDIDILANEFGTSKQKIETIITNYGLFKLSKDGKFFSPNLFKYMEPLNNKKINSAIWGMKGNLIKYNHKTEEELEGVSANDIIQFAEDAGFKIPNIGIYSAPDIILLEDNSNTYLGGELGGESGMSREAIAIKEKKTNKTNKTNKMKENNISDSSPPTSTIFSPTPDFTKSGFKEDTKKPTKHKHGEYKHVMLTDDEYDSLNSKLSDREDLIKRLDEYIETSGKKYKNHSLVMQNWDKKNNPEKGKEDKKIDYAEGFEEWGK